MIEAACHCGAVKLTAPSAPDTVTECNCSICRRLAARWAYYSPAEVGMPKAGSTQPYVWGDRMLAFHRCKSLRRHHPLAEPRRGPGADGDQRAH